MRRLTALRSAGFAILLALAGPSAAQSPDSEIRAVVGRWYEEIAKREKGYLWNRDLVAPGFIDASPPVTYAKSRSRARAPRIYGSLGARALKFAWEIDSIRRDSAFAKVQVWERGYFYAAAAQVTYENAAATTFILERSAKDGRWRIAAHQSSGQGIPPNKITDPLPDLRALYYSTEGKDRDPAADARAARNF
ncbi:MAG TPA: hypothetical protein VE891_13075 [Allosphingosinicella sp.]|nr:hypothetical protein [Allosphingosinicella sp.]